jgi:hypothetical protein
MRSTFASRFPTVARLLSSTGLTSTPPEDEDDAGGDDAGGEEDAGGGSDGGNAQGKNAGRLDAAGQVKLQTAFEADAEKLVKAERDRWNAVLVSDEGKANAGMARSLLNKTSMSSEDIIEALAEDGGKDASSRARETSRSASEGRERLQRSRGVDRDTGGAGGKERQGASKDELLEDARDRRREMQEKRNQGVQSRRGGAAQKKPA